MKSFMRCNFCGDVKVNPGTLTQHYETEHWQMHKAVLRGRKHRDRKCRACPASQGPFQTQKKLKAHIVDRGEHSITELLDAGYEAWLTHIDSRASAVAVNDWLLAKGFVVLEPVEAEKIKQEEEEWQERPRKRTAKALLKKEVKLEAGQASFD